MKQIPLTQGKFALVDDEDFEWLNQWRWFCHDGCYAARMSPRVKGKQSMIRMHRLITDAPDGLEVDHINHDMLDNRRENLRVCTKTENQYNANLRTDSATGFKGVSKNKRRFEARIRGDGKLLYLGTYDTPEEAAHVYDEAAKKFFGEFAKTNFCIPQEPA